MSLFSWGKKKQAQDVAIYADGPQPSTMVPAPVVEPAAEPMRQAQTDAEPVQSAETDVEAPQPRRFRLEREFMFDLDKTSRLSELVRVPRNRRTADWTEAFFDAAWDASLEVGEPAFFEGPDTYTYVRMHLSEPGKPFQSNSLANVAPFAVERGAGIAIFGSPTAKEPEYVMSMGRVDSLLRFDSWQGDPQDLREVAASKTPSEKSLHGLETVTLQKNTQMFIGAPAAALLPPYAAGMLHRHLTQGWSLTDPRIALLIVPDVAPTRNLVVGKRMSDFPDKDTAARHTQALLWYLPPSQSLMLMPENMSLDEMVPLTNYFKSVPAPPA